LNWSEIREQFCGQNPDFVARLRAPRFRLRVAASVDKPRDKPLNPGYAR
jgi:hypothetical protein